MKFSVITPSFNQVQFLPDNLRTVSSQKGVEVEHIIVDPGSTDGSTELAREARHAILIDEPDRGQSHGITKGYNRATGDILVWLNSDDFYPDDQVLARVARAFDENPDADIIYGNVNFVDESGAFLRKGFVNRDSENLLKSFQYQVGIVQPGVFMRRRVFDTVGGPSEDYNYCMDYEYWVRKGTAGFRWVFLDQVVAHHRWWSGMKTSSGRGESLIEHFKVCSTYFGYIHHKWLDRYGEFVASNSDGVVNHSSNVDEKVKASCVRLAIERFVTQDMLAKLEASNEPELSATLAYIRRMAPDLQRFAFDDNDLTDAVSVHADPMAKQRVAWHVFDTATPDGREFKTYQVPDNFTRHFDKGWYNYQHERAKEKIARLSARRKDTCVIVANGPSLNQSNFDMLSDADVIISNYAIISKPLMRHATCLTIVNDLVASQGSIPFNDLDLIKILPFWLANSINPSDSTYFVPATVEPKFCTEIGGVFSWRSTVSFLNMQLAFVLGYERVALIGFDHSYQQAADLKEGASVEQKEEDANHFDPRYFQGKNWQAADTNNMEKMYLLARDAYQQAGRTIINATVGGKLEVFPRASLETALGLPTGGRIVRQSAAVLGAPTIPAKPSGGETEKSPRILMFDMTAMGDQSATGALKSTLLADWPEDRVLQIAKQGPGGLASVVRKGDRYQIEPLNLASARETISKFAPDMILYRPVPDTEALHSLAMTEIRARSLPLVTWIMDDWPARMAAEDPSAWTKMKNDLAYLLETSTVRLSICEAMSTAYAQRYGCSFIPFANGVDPSDWPAVAKRSTEDGIFRVRFAGGLAPDMNRASILRVAEVVERIGNSGVSIAFQISTQKWWLAQTANLFERFKHTRVQVADASAAGFREWISQADAVVIAYNFDAASRQYTQYSMANKMPECLASGSVLFAHGPRGLATIDYLAGVEGAVVVTEDSDAAVESALRRLQADPARRADLAAKARTTAFERHNLIRLREELRQILFTASRTASTAEAARGAPPEQAITLAAQLLCAPGEALHWIETDAAVEDLVARTLGGGYPDRRLSEHLEKCIAFARKKTRA